MERNTVLLDVNDYNGLRDFKKAIEDGGGCDIYFDSGWNVRIYTQNEAISRIGEANRKLRVRNLDLQKRLENRDKPADITLEDVRKMNWREFRKWKKNG